MKTKLKLAIFDVDGVLLDSMGVWRKVGDDLLERNNIVFSEETRKWIDTLTVEEVAAYLNEHYHLRDTDEEIVQEICGAVEEAYFHTIPAKPYLEEMLQWLFRYYEERPELLPADFQPQLSLDGMRRTVCDYIAGMTDKFAVDKYTELFIPTGWHIR